MIAHYPQAHYPLQDLTGLIIRGFYTVYGELVYGFLESVYERSMVIVLTDMGLSVRHQVEVPVRFRSAEVGIYRADLVVEDVVVVELKAGPTLHPAHSAQLLNLLRGSGLAVGLLLHFGPKPRIKRLIMSRH
ncbi:MAG: GxxExxY protein [Gemmatimonadales bacterium]